MMGLKMQTDSEHPLAARAARLKELAPHLIAQLMLYPTAAGGRKNPILPGFGHPQHSGGDPRANRLLAMADERGVSGEHVAMMRALKAALPETIGRDLPINVNAAIPSIMLDLGFPLAALKGIGLLCRTASLVAHCTEEAERPIGFVMSGAAAAALEFDGE